MKESEQARAASDLVERLMAMAPHAQDDWRLAREAAAEITRLRDLETRIVGLEAMLVDSQAEVERLTALVKARDDETVALAAKAEKTRPAHEFIAELRDRERKRIRDDVVELCAKVADEFASAEQKRLASAIAHSIRALKDGAV